MAANNTTTLTTSCKGYMLVFFMIKLILFPFIQFIFLCSSLYNYLSKLFSSGEKKPRLPPGTMGWPYVGETYKLYSSNNPITFFAIKEKMYGSVLKTHILGCPCVMVSSPEAVKFVMVTKAHLFKPTFPESKERMLGKQAIFFQCGDYHAKLRKLVLRAFMPAAIRTRVAEIEAIAITTLRSWVGHEINTYEEMKTYAFNIAIQSIFGINQEDQTHIEELKQHYYTLEKGYNSMPINLHGTLFHKAMKARSQLGQILTKIMDSRREKKIEANDLLGSFMGSKEELSDEQVADNIIGVIFAARDTTATVLTWTVKYLGQNPKILQAVTEEQEAILKEKRDNKVPSLSWDDMKKMPMTSCVIQETLRVASVISFTFREAVEDVEYDGHLIPKGWKVMPLFRNIHHKAEIFPDPEKFDPSRFVNIQPKPNTYMPFGNGNHCCPGNELAKLEILVLLHHLTTKYRWCLSLPESDDVGVQFGPFPLPMNGLPIRFFKRITKSNKDQLC